MTPKNIEVIDALEKYIVPIDERHLHIIQMAKAIKPFPITRTSDSDILLQVQNDDIC